MMGYSKEYAYGKVNTSNAAELMKCCRPELNGDCQVMITGYAYDTGFTSGDAVSVTPSAAGWLVDDVIADQDQYIGIVQDTPGATGANVRVCMGGMTYVNGNGSTKYATAWAGPLEFCADVPSVTAAVTAIATNAFGWPVTSGAYGTGVARMIFLDQPWKLIDVTTP